MNRRGRSRQGSTLVIVLIMGVLLMGLAVATANIAISGRQAASADRVNADIGYDCESAAELLRLELVRDWDASGFTPGLWVGERLRKTSATTADAPRNDRTTPGTPLDPRGYPRTYPTFPGVRVWVDRVGPPGQNWVEVVASTTPGTGTARGDTRRPQSVRYRFSWGNNPIFELAMLTVTTNCMFCHMRIQGDVGSIGYFRPGWGNPAPGENGDGSGGDSFIHGDIYTASNTIDMNNLNGQNGNVSGSFTTSQGTFNLYKNYTDSKLPKDTIGNDGVPDFPAINPVEARLSSKGTVWAGNPSNNNNASDGGVWVVPLGGNFATDKRTPTKADFQSGAASALTNATGSVVNGNLVLVGTAAHPIQLNGDVFVEGDVIIKGPVQGKGAIYSARNTYLAGDITYTAAATPAGWVGGGPPPSSGSSPLRNDTGAAASITGEPSAGELRLASRGNIIVGDYTYLKDDNATVNEMRHRQGQDFMRAQFELWQTRYFDVNDASSELTPKDTNSDGTPDEFYNDQGLKITDSSRIAVVYQGQDPPGPAANYYTGTMSTFDRNLYDASISPGRVVRQADGTGVFQGWISQSEYRQFLGTKTYSDVTWRFEGGSTSAAQRQAELGAVPTNHNGSGFPGGNWRDMPNTSWFEPDKFGADKGQFVRKDGSTYRVMDTGTKSWPTRVERVDAFLYANKRIGGVVLGTGLTVNGGMASEKIGVLAPGVKESEWWSTRNNLHGNLTTTDKNRFPANSSRWWANVPENDPRRRMYLNYDYRLRNGGYGFNLVEGMAGDAAIYQRGRPVTPPTP